MLNTSADGLLEIRVRPMAQAYETELRFFNYKSQGVNEPARGPSPISVFVLAVLKADPLAYGQALSAAVFQDNSVLALFREAKNDILKQGGHLRVSVIVDPKAHELHALAWELLTDPTTDSYFSTDERTPFSRFLYGRDWTNIVPRQRGNWTAVIAVPDPKDLNDFRSRLARVDPASEIDFARQALSGANVRVVQGPVTASALLNEIENGADVVYLVCHGEMRSIKDLDDVSGLNTDFGRAAHMALDGGLHVPVLLLENSEGNLEFVYAGAITRRIAEMGQRPRPRLFVLASCESAGREDDWTGQSAQASAAPLLARAGIPAIVAMQGKIRTATARRLVKPFFEELNRHGSIDRAMAKARGAVSDMNDGWMPALFLRLVDGQLWYEPGFNPDATANFEAIAREIAAGKVTPIVGWGLAEAIYGTKLSLSERLANAQQVPLEAHRLGELPLVSQYVRLSTRSAITAIDKLKEQMRAEVLGRFENKLRGDTCPLDDDCSLSEALSAAGAWQRRNNELDPYRIIANLPATVFINTSHDNLLIDALEEAQKTPIIRNPHWRSATAVEQETLNPTIEAPLVLQVFGHFSDSDSLVLGEDDYFDFLMGVAQNQALISNAVKNALTDRALMFVGFNVADWSFRVLFRIVMRLMAGSSVRQEGKPNVAVQVEPGGTMFAGPDEARQYLKKYYGPSNIESFWGTSEEFLSALWPKLAVHLDLSKMPYLPLFSSTSKPQKRKF